MQNLQPWETSWKTEIIDNNQEIINPLPEVMEAYIRRRLDLAYDLTMNQESSCPFTYTAMHGVGYRYVQYVFDNLKFQVIINRLHNF